MELISAITEAAMRGTTNTLRVLGTKAGLIVLAGDILKCILAIAAVRLLFAGGVHEDMYYLQNNELMIQHHIAFL